MDPLELIWDETDKVFHDWIAGKPIKETSPFNEVIKSVFIFSREKFKKSIDPLCIQALDFLGKKEKEDQEALESISFSLEKPQEDYEHEEEVQEEEEEEEEEIPEYVSTRQIMSRAVSPLWENDSILSDIISGKQEIFNELYENEFPAVIRHILKNNGTVEDARDIFQDALIIMVEKAFHGKIDLKYRNIKSYIFGISIRLWYARLRQMKLSRLLSDDLNYLLKDEPEVIFYEQPDKYVELAKEIEQLGPRCKELLHYFYYLNQNWQTIAQDLGYSSASVARKQKFKCLEKIRDRLNNGN